VFYKTVLACIHRKIVRVRDRKTRPWSLWQLLPEPQRTLFVSVAGCLIVLMFSYGALAQVPQQRWEISPFVGFETGASAPAANSVDPNTGLPLSPIDQIGVDKSLSYGSFLDYAETKDFGFEFMWLRESTSYTEHDASVGQTFTVNDTNIDAYQFGIVYQIFGSEKLRPYAAAGLGFSHDSDSLGTGGSTAFAFNLGGGAKYYLSSHFGLRGDLRFLPTLANSSQGEVCDPFNGCFPTTQHNFFKRVNLASGVLIRF